MNLYIDDARQDIGYLFKRRWKKKRKIELVCSVATGISRIAQTDAVTARHLRKVAKTCAHLLGFPFRKDIDASYDLVLYSSNNRPQSHLLILLEDFVRPLYHRGHQSVHQCSPLVSPYQHGLLRGHQRSVSP